MQRGGIGMPSYLTHPTRGCHPTSLSLFMPLPEALPLSLPRDLRKGPLLLSASTETIHHAKACFRVGIQCRAGESRASAPRLPKSRFHHLNEGDSPRSRDHTLGPGTPGLKVLIQELLQV